MEPKYRIKANAHWDKTIEIDGDDIPIGGEAAITVDNYHPEKALILAKKIVSLLNNREKLILIAESYIRVLKEQVAGAGAQSQEAIDEINKVLNELQQS